MAEANISVDQDQFCCPVCLDLLKDPVTIPCGHSYCKVCINSCWDQDDQKGVYSCPQCRGTFTLRPVLCRNNIIAEMVEKLQKTRFQATSPAHCYAGPGDVECDFCTERKHKAIKSCLVCLASFCEPHLKPHYQSPAFKKHKLVKASKQLQEKICSQHGEVIKVYCRTDQSCICYLCMNEEHKGCNTVSAATERTQKQGKVNEMQIQCQQKIQENKKKLQEVKQVVNDIKGSAQAAVEDSERIFTDLIHFIEIRRSEVTELIRDQEKTHLSGAEELLEQLEQELADLKKRDTELEQLSHTEDHIQFLQSFQCLCVSSGCKDSPSLTVNQHLSFDGMRKSLFDLKERLEEFCKAEFSRIPAHGKHYFLSPQTRHPQQLLSRPQLLRPWSVSAGPATGVAPVKAVLHYEYSPEVINLLQHLDNQSQAHMQQPAVHVQDQEPLNTSMLVRASEGQQKQMLGNQLYPLIHSMHPTLAGKITGMLLELDNTEIVHMLESPKSLQSKVDEAVAVLEAHWANEAAKKCVTETALSFDGRLLLSTQLQDRDGKKALKKSKKKKR